MALREWAEQEREAVRRKTPESCSLCRQKYAHIPNLPDCEDPQGVMRDCPRKKQKALLKDLPEDFQEMLFLARTSILLGVPPLNEPLLDWDLTFTFLLIELKQMEASFSLEQLEKPFGRLKHHFRY